jgi:peptide/nickel transport system substrate-binding protein
MFTPRNLDFVSRRLGNYTYSNQYHLLYDQVWVQ